MTRPSLRRLSSLAVLAAWLGGIFGAVVFPHAEGIDIACGDISLAAGDPTSRIEAPGMAAGDGHCVLCHLQRVGRSAIAGSLRAGHVVQIETPAPVCVRAAVLASSAALLPSRGPPPLPA